LSETQPDTEGNEPHFLADPDVSDAFGRLLQEFSVETDRGAVLIAGEMVAEHLAKVIQTLAPAGFENGQVRSMMKYPGLLGSFAAKADVALMAGFINSTAYRSISLLRSIRNKAAHSQASFKLSNHQEKLSQLCDLGPGTSVTVQRCALELLATNFIETLRAQGVEMEAEFGHNPFSTVAEIHEHLKARPDAMAALQDRAPRMELAFGVWLLLGLITHHRKAVQAERAAKETPSA